MKTKRCLILITISFSLIFSTCKKDNIVLPTQDLDKLIGKWIWVQSSGGFAGEVTTPSSTGHTQMVEFKNNGDFNLYQDDKVVGKWKFTMTEGSSIFSQESAFLITYSPSNGNTNHRETQSIRTISKSELVLRDECFDCYENVYVRK